MTTELDIPHVSTGNSKGVMFCKRPIGGTSPVLKHQAADGATGWSGGSFICGTVKKPWGNNVVIAEKERVLCSLSNKDGALSKHKKWLSDLQKEKDKREKERLEDDAAKEEKKKKFQDTAAKMRARALEDLDGRGEQDEQSPDEADISNERATSGPIPKTVTVSRDDSTPELDGQKNETATETHRPAWALTEPAATEQEEVDELNEQDELLSFVNSLDFEKYDNDLELQVLMDQVKERIKSLERDKRKDEARLTTALDSEEAASKADGHNDAVIYGLNDSRIVADGDDDDDVKSIAASVMSDDASVRSIHSRKSMEVLVSKAKAKLSTSMEPIPEKVPEVSLSPPLLVKHIEDDGARLRETKSLNKLPFKNRNPAL